MNWSTEWCFCSTWNKHNFDVVNILLLYSIKLVYFCCLLSPDIFYCDSDFIEHEFRIEYDSFELNSSVLLYWIDMNSIVNILWILLKINVNESCTNTYIDEFCKRRESAIYRSIDILFENSFCFGWNQLLHKYSLDLGISKTHINMQYAIWIKSSSLINLSYTCLTLVFVFIGIEFSVKNHFIKSWWNQYLFKSLAFRSYF